MVSETNRFGAPNPGGEIRYFQYDLVGNLTQQTDRNGRVRQFDDNARNWLVQERWLDGATVVNTVDWTYDSLGRVAAASDDFSQYQYAYDKDDRLTSQTNSGTPGTVEVAFTYAYDDANRQWTRSDTLAGAASGQIVTFYDELDRRPNGRRGDR